MEKESNFERRNRASAFSRDKSGLGMIGDKIQDYTVMNGALPVSPPFSSSSVKAHFQVSDQRIVTS